MEQLLAAAQENSTGSSAFSTILSIATIAGLWKMFTKAGEPGWISLIPFYNEYKLCEKVMGNPWYWLRLLVVIIPLIGWVAFFYFQFQIGKATAKAFGQPESWAWGYTFVSPVLYCITGFGNYEYYGPNGERDKRTGDARQAKTVDFDVIKNEPVTPVRETPVAPAGDPNEAGDVEFIFDQDIIE